MSSKLTLSVDERVVRQAKRYARKRGTSVSQLVEDYLDLVSGPGAGAEAPPVLRRLRGALKGVSEETYRRYLRGKYR
jgi:hypothetical protein